MLQVLGFECEGSGLRIRFAGLVFGFSFRVWVSGFRVRG